MEEIRLKAGTQHVTVEEIPRLLAIAIHPEVAADRVVHHLEKSTAGTKNRAGTRASLSPSDIKALCAIWNCEPDAWNGISEDQWSTWSQDFTVARKRRTWFPMPIWTNHALNAGILRADAQMEHKRALTMAMGRGEVQALTHAMLPSPGYPTDIVPVTAFAAYAEKFNVPVVVQPSDAGSGPFYWTLEKSAAAIAAQEGWHNNARKTFLAQLVDAAEDGTLTVRHPHTNLPYRPSPVREFNELVTHADVNGWLARSGTSLRWNDDKLSKPGGAIAAPARSSADVVHKLRTRTGPLDAVIKRAAVAAEDPSDPLSAWAALVRMASMPRPPAPVIGYVDAEGVQYTAAEKSTPAYLSKKNFARRFKRGVENGWL